MIKSFRELTFALKNSSYDEALQENVCVEGFLKKICSLENLPTNDKSLILVKESVLGKIMIRSSYSYFTEQILTTAGMHFIPEYILFSLF